MIHHPEQRDDEIYMGNTRREDVEKSSWKTSRLGGQALKRDDTPCEQLGAEPLKPWFIKASEVERDIEQRRSDGRPGSADTIKALESMLAIRSVFID